MVNYLSRLSARLAELERPLRELSKKSNAWVWEEEQMRAFEDVKREIGRALVLAKYDLRAPHRVTVDSSSYVIGAALLQRDDAGG